jgi:hypothetical protein
MRNLIVILSTIFILFEFGCEQVDVISPQTSYKEYTVVRAELKADKSFGGVTFTKTLPLDEAYDIKKAELKNVSAFIIINGIQVVPLHYTQDGIYNSLYEFKIQHGYTYELYAKVGDKSIYSKTEVPFMPVILSAEYKSDNHIEVRAKGHANEIFGASWVIMSPYTNNILEMSPDFQELVDSPKDSFLTVQLGTMDVPDKYRDNVYENSTYVQVFSFDPQYLGYFESRNNNQPINNAFTQGGGQIVWNVQGNNVIGLFIGYTVSNNYKVPFR